MKIKISLIAALSSWFLAGCATNSSSYNSIYLPEPTIGSSPRPQTPTTPVAPPALQPSAPVIDYVGLQQSLGLDRDARNLGFSEKSFNTCLVGHGFSDSEDCRRLYMVVINFQLLCRYSEGTISRALSSLDMQPISSRSVNWNLRTENGSIYTDSDGFGQIRSTSEASGKQQRLKLAVGNDFLYMRATDITRVVTPSPWCQP